MNTSEKSKPMLCCAIETLGTVFGILFMLGAAMIISAVIGGFFQISHFFIVLSFGFLSWISIGLSEFIEDIYKALIIYIKKNGEKNV